MTRGAGKRRPAPSASPRRERTPGLAPVLLLSMVIAFTAIGCPCVDSTINANPWLRWKLFAMFGAGRVCEEMTRRGVGLRLTDSGPVVGRFFPSQCQSTTQDERRTLRLQFSGDGYAWTPVTRRMAFSSSASIEYSPDFYKDGGTIYVFFRPASLPAPLFQVTFVEQPLLGAATVGTPLGTVANVFGQQIVSLVLGRGFTVIHESGGDDFSLGILTPPARPAHPFDQRGSDRFVLLNETAELHAGQLDFLGPFEVDEADRALFTTIRVAGPAIDMALVPRSAGDVWRRAYQAGPGVPTPPAVPLATGVVRPSVTANQTFPLPRGSYYLVADNSAYLGQVAPPPSLLEMPAGISYVVSIGDAP